ncbi:alpha/beta fold hydrolase [Promethearchaeum syntrophicum]|uniref:Alpha/beta fold hydrolase n=1 Tax=Promethearchaeum syntrophicum TaxID=2594042 RepID=A0A5B9DEK0_9ARCH|nr:alpha/beta fold hydrolase [Candidatus Prometheoarchaeum syntrophicum]QEE17668.1 lysophospholipase L2 [Candidatus Prometheoarchaeum syntrophicum]
MEKIYNKKKTISKGEFLKKSKEINPLLKKIQKNINVDAGYGSFFITSTNFKLFNREWVPKNITPSSKVIICIHGMHSHGEKFVLLADKFVNFNWVTIAVDLRGHGLSWDKFEERGDIENYSLWISDLKEFFKYISEKYKNLPLHIISESMGSAISILVAIKNPSLLKSLILLSPALKPWAVTEISLIQKAFTYGLIGGAEKQIILNKAKGRFSTNSEEYIQYQLNDPFRLDKVSPRYYFQIIKMIHQLKALDFNNFYPTLIFFGGSDHIIDFTGLKELIYRLKIRDKGLHYIPKASHELLTDHQAIKYNLYKKIISWIQMH